MKKHGKNLIGIYRVKKCSDILRIPEQEDKLFKSNRVNCINYNITIAYWVNGTGHDMYLNSLK